MSHLIRIAVLAAICGTGGCSPYVYKDEIKGFATGVDQLSGAAKVGVKGVADDHSSAQRLRWARQRAVISPTGDCSPNPLAPPPGTICTLHEAGKPVLPPPAIQGEGARTVEYIKVLQDYAAALLAVTNADDRAALDSAAKDLGQSISSIVTAVGGKTGAAGPLGDLVASALGAFLDAARLRVLKERVGEAQPWIAQLGPKFGDALVIIRDARRTEQANVATSISTSLLSTTDPGSYAAQLTALQSTVTSIEALRVSDPRAAALDMVKAHDALAKALADDSRQIEAVGAAIKDFITKAKALRAAMSGDAS